MKKVALENATSTKSKKKQKNNLNKKHLDMLGKMSLEEKIEAAARKVQMRKGNLKP